MPGASLEVTVLIYAFEPIRFGLRHYYSQDLLRIYKGIPDASFDQTRKMWHFSWHSHEEVVQKLRSVPGVDLHELPRFLKAAMKPTHEVLPGKNRGNGAPALIGEEEEYSQRVESVPEELRSTLYPFQVDCLRFAIEKRGRIILGDEMGLGKTLQALAIACAYREAWPLLVVAPSSVRSNWRNESVKWVPGLTVDNVQIIKDGKDGVRDSASMIIVSYDLATRMVDKSLLWKGQFQFIIADESHLLKSIDAQRTQALLPLMHSAARVLCLSGTPALSRPAELFTQLNALLPEAFSSFVPFAKRYCDPRPAPWGGLSYNGSSNTEELKMVLEKIVMIRRLKDQVLSQLLPEKDRQMVDVPCDSERMEEVADLLASKKDIDVAIEAAQDDSEKMTLNNVRKGVVAKLHGASGMAKVQGVLAHLQKLLAPGMDMDVSTETARKDASTAILSSNASDSLRPGELIVATEDGGSKRNKRSAKHARGDGPVAPWTCARCTFENLGSLRECDMCGWEYSEESKPRAGRHNEDTDLSVHHGTQHVHVATARARKVDLSGDDLQGTRREIKSQKKLAEATPLAHEEPVGLGAQESMKRSLSTDPKSPETSASEAGDGALDFDSESEDDGSFGVKRPRGGRKLVRLADEPTGSSGSDGRSDPEDDDRTFEVATLRRGGSDTRRSRKRGRECMGKRPRSQRKTFMGDGGGGGNCAPDEEQDFEEATDSSNGNARDDPRVSSRISQGRAIGLRHVRTARDRRAARLSTLSSAERESRAKAEATKWSRRRAKGEVAGRGTSGRGRDGRGRDREMSADLVEDVTIDAIGRGKAGESAHLLDEWPRDKGESSGRRRTRVAAGDRGSTEKVVLSSIAEKKSPKLVVFAHHKAVMDTLEEGLKNMGVSCVRIDGATAQAKRQPIVDCFQREESLSVILLAITAAGVGITLTAASCAIFAELYWTPGSMAQAEDRIHRIGQKAKTVVIQYMIGRGTMDDDMITTIHRKQTTLKSTVGLNRDAGGYSNVLGREHRLQSPGRTPSPNRRQSRRQSQPAADPSQRKLEFAPVKSQPKPILIAAPSGGDKTCDAEPSLNPATRSTSPAGAALSALQVAGLQSQTRLLLGNSEEANCVDLSQSPDDPPSSVGASARAASSASATSCERRAACSPSTTTVKLQHRDKPAMAVAGPSLSNGHLVAASVGSAKPAKRTTVLTAEQKERIARNKLAAQQKLAERRRQREELQRQQERGHFDRPHTLGSGASQDMGSCNEDPSWHSQPHPRLEEEQRREEQQQQHTKLWHSQPSNPYRRTVDTSGPQMQRGRPSSSTQGEGLPSAQCSAVGVQSSPGRDPQSRSFYGDTAKHRGQVAGVDTEAAAEVARRQKSRRRAD